MELTEDIKQDLEALAQVTGQEKTEIVEQAVDQYFKETSAQLVRQQTQQSQMQEVAEQDIETEE